MSKLEPPKIGDRISVEKFFVSKMNVRASEKFGVGDKDEALQDHLMTSSIVQPFIARPEDKEGHWERGMDLSKAIGYGVVVGRRRFLSKKDHLTHFVVGKDALIQELTDEEAGDMSLRENLDIFRKDLDSITRGEKLNELISRSTLSLRGWARKWNMSPQTLSDWIRVSDLSPKMREALRRSIIPFWDGRKVAGLKLGTELQEKLGEVALTDGLDAFRRELARLMAGKGKRGVPRGIYLVDRVIWDKRNRRELEYYDILTKVAEAKGIKTAEYIKQYIIRHIDEIAKEIP